MIAEENGFIDRPLGNLENSRETLIEEIERIDVKRRELKARIVLMNRQRNISKDHIARMQAESAELLQRRGHVRGELGKLNEEIKMFRRLSSGGVPQETVAQAFLRIARSMMPKEMYEDILSLARERAAKTPDDAANCGNVAVSGDGHVQPLRIRHRP
jgi:hypothetical protein